MAAVLNGSGLTIDKIISGDIKTINGDEYLTKKDADALFQSKNGSTSSGGTEAAGEYDYTPALEQKIQFSLNTPYITMMNGWFVVNPEISNIPERWTISIGYRDDDGGDIEYRPMFHSDSDGNMSISTLVKPGQIIISTASIDKNGYFMPCTSELKDWRAESLKNNDVDIWKKAVVTDADGQTEVRNLWLDNTSASNWNAIEDTQTYKSTLSYIKNDEAFDAKDGHIFYIQTENIKTGYNMFNNCSSLSSFNGDLSSLTDGYAMFNNCSSLSSFNGDLSSLTDGTNMFANCKLLASFNGDLSSLNNGTNMFLGCEVLAGFSEDLSSLTDGTSMFTKCFSLSSFSGDLSSLTDGTSMFYKTKIESFNGDLSSLVEGGSMFSGSSLKSFNGSLSSLTNGNNMFNGCTSLQSFSGDLGSLTNGTSMFEGCTSLQSFSGDLGSLTNGTSMFSGCKLDLASVQNIESTINTVSSGTITIGIQSSLQGNTTLDGVLYDIRIKGWTVEVSYN